MKLNTYQITNPKKISNYHPSKNLKTSKNLIILKKMRLNPPLSNKPDLLSKKTLLATYTLLLLFFSTNPLSSTQNALSKFEQAIYEVSIEDQELLAVYKVSIDLRHISNYNGSFNYEQQWEIKLRYISTDESDIQIVFDNSFYPEPTGYFSSSNVPFR